MIIKIIAIILLGATAFLSIKHGWDALHINDHPEQAKMFTDLGFKKSMFPVFGIISILIGLLLLFPQTFLVGCILNAFTIVLVMALALDTGIIKMALIEIPFLLMPLVLIWLKYPIKF